MSTTATTTEDTTETVVVPHGRMTPLVFVKEIVVIFAVYLAYRQVRYFTRDDGQVALRNARKVLQLQEHLSWLSEKSVQHLALRSEAFVEFLNRYYVTVHFPLTVAFLVWVLVFRRQWYRVVRNWLIALTSAGLVIHVLFPLAPPRMMPGFVDTLRRFGPNIYSSDPNASVANQFAAMPSLHFGWSMVVAAGFILIVRRRWTLVALFHPLLTLTAIVATGNHYFLDATVAGVLVVMVAVTMPGVRRLLRSQAGIVVNLPDLADPARWAAGTVGRDAAAWGGTGFTPADSQ